MKLFLVICILLMLPSTVQGQTVGEAAPDFSTTIYDGAETRLSDLRGTVVVLNFWASWCGPCKVELPFLAELYKEHGDNGLEILAINVDSEVTDMEGFMGAADFEIPFPIISDTAGDIPELYNIPGMPTVVFIDKKGIIRHIHSGFRSSFEEAYKSELSNLMAEGE